MIETEQERVTRDWNDFSARYSRGEWKQEQFTIFVAKMLMELTVAVYELRDALRAKQ